MELNPSFHSHWAWPNHHHHWPWWPMTNVVASKDAPQALLSLHWDPGEFNCPWQNTGICVLYDICVDGKRGMGVVYNSNCSRKWLTLGNKAVLNTTCMNKTHPQNHNHWKNKTIDKKPQSTSSSSSSSSSSSVAMKAKHSSYIFRRCVWKWVFRIW